MAVDLILLLLICGVLALSWWDNRSLGAKLSKLKPFENTQHYREIISTLDGLSGDVSALRKDVSALQTTMRHARLAEVATKMSQAELKLAHVITRMHALENMERVDPAVVSPSPAQRIHDQGAELRQTIRQKGQDVRTRTEQTIEEILSRAGERNGG